MRDVANAAGEQLLDVGCGTGSLLLTVAPMLPAGARLVGVDTSVRMLASLRASPRIEVRPLDVGTAGVRDYPRAQYSHVVSSIALMFVPVVSHVLDTLHALLRDDGTLLLAVWGRREHCSAVASLEGALGCTVHPANWRLSNLLSLTGLLQAAHFR